MDRSPLLLSVLTLSITACTTPAEHGADACKTEPGQRFVGAKAESETAIALLRATHAVELRWLPPGTIVTAEYKYGRLTVDLDDTNTITRVACG